MRLEIGTRDIPIEGYMHLDIYPGPHIECVADATKLPFRDDALGEIFACHIIEHIPWYKAAGTLTEWYRVVKPGGFAEIWTNDFEKLCRTYLREDKITSPAGRFADLNPDNVKQLWVNIKIFWHDYLGHQEEWHKAVFDFELLRYLLEKSEFNVIIRLERYENKGPDHGILEFGVRAYKQGDEKAILLARQAEVYKFSVERLRKRRKEMTASPIKLAKRVAKRLLSVFAPQLLLKRQAQQRAEAIKQERLSCAQSPKAKVFLTGDLGKLGTCIANTLKYDYEIEGFDLQYGPKEDLANYEYLKERMHGCEYVIHAAALPHPRMASMERYVEVNVLGSFNVMRAAAENKVKRFIFISSTAYYGCDIEGKLIPAYFPIDEAHPISAMEGRSEGGLDAYNQSKVMAEQLLAYYGTNKLFQSIALRFAPVHSKASLYPADDDSWRERPSFRRGCFYTNCNPKFVVQAVVLALESPGEFWYEAFNIVDRYTHESINVHDFLAKEYPGVPVRGELSPHQALISPAKAERVLGFRPCKDLR